MTCACAAGPRTQVTARPWHGPLPRLYTDYQTRFGRLAGRFAWHPWQRATYVQRAEALSRFDAERPSGHRTALSRALFDHNQRLGAAPATLAHIGDLEQPGTLAVVTGQQAGLFTGPLYTINKAISVVKQAQRLSQELKRPVVPIFWVASEDHDFDEIAWATIVDRKGRLTTLRLDREEGEWLHAIGERRIPPQAEALIADLEQALGVARAELLRTTLAEARGGSLADWFTRQMLRLFAPWGLVVIDPMWPEVRQLASPLIQQAVLNREQVAAALAAGTEAVQRLGYPAQIQTEPGHMHLFRFVEGRRTALICDDDLVHGRHGEAPASLAQVAGEVAETPERFSPDVALRPVVQQWLLPTLVHVVGPGETAYAAQLKELFTVLGLSQPIYRPRFTATVVDSETAQALELLGLQPEEALTGLSGREEELLARLEGWSVDPLIQRLQDRVEAAYHEFAAEAKVLGQGFAALVDRNLEHVRFQLQYLGKKSRQHHRRRNQEAARALQLAAALAPGADGVPRVGPGGPQDRILNVYSFLLRHGSSWLEQLVEAAPEAGIAVEPPRAPQWLICWSASR